LLTLFFLLNYRVGPVVGQLSYYSHTYYTNNSLAYLLLSPPLQGWSCGGTALILATQITPIIALLTLFFLLNYRVGPVVGHLSYYI
jgi:hypothetical protein